MNKHLSIIFVMLFAASCGDNEIANQAPSFGFQKERIVRVNEGSTDIGSFQATDADGDEISYSISNLDMNITQDGVVTFNIIPDFEIESVYSATIVASNDGGSDEINLMVYINDSDCEFDTAAAFNLCFFH
ncbi:cadherin repeat domain-containing protein [Gammaproteobacteria bacterium]|nr:cadherin repeat domain-containing protein [Gammaproteobacteria bacterium]MDA9010982.1 cadherin repeat domain-containing protein [Gammaproteobacteria bacterium]MDA9117834.1 cadherin repeat domain-containing protein [Gammaproteobacteria bacterium]MDA9195706.1 cadherin repeat domain-containing protein [Gammaproteobacteria bacterium]